MPVLLIRRIFAVGGALAFVFGCASPPRSIDFQAVRAGPVTADGLQEIEGRGVSAAFMRPEAAFAAYDEVSVDPLRISHKEGSRPLDQASLERLARIFAESCEEQLHRSEAYTVVTEPGPRTLRIVGRVVNLDLRIGRYRGGEKKMVLNSGEMTLVLDVRDSRTGETLARIADRRPIRPKGVSETGNAHRAGYTGYEDTPVNVWGAMREIVDDWARILRQGLDDLNAMAPVPIPDDLGDG